MKKKKFLRITYYILSCIVISSVTTFVIFRFIPEVKDECNPTSSLDTFIFILTLIVAVLAILFAVLGYNEFTRVIDYTKKVDDFEHSINDYSKKADKVESITNQIQQIQRSLIRQERYIDHTAKYIYQVTYAKFEQMNNQAEAQQLLNHLYHELQIFILYRANMDADKTNVVDINKIAALEYLEGEGNGTMDDIPHLDYVVENDPDERIRQRAIEVRAIIRNRNNN